MWRSVRWLDRCMSAHRRSDQQSLFGIIQGGLQPALREKCVDGKCTEGRIVTGLVPMLYQIA